MSIKDILQRKKINSNINPIARMGVPVRSNYSRAAETIKDPTEDLGLLGTAGNIAAGLTAGLKSGLGFYGAMQDARNQQAYNNYLAQVAEQERADKLAQQATENEYKTNALAQQKELAQMGIDAQTAARAEQFANQKEMEAIKQANALELQKLNAKSALDVAAAKRSQDLSDLKAKYAREDALYKRGLLEKGIDPDLYGTDAEYTALVNDAVRKQAVQDQLNAANIELGKAGKVGMDKVEQVINDPARKLEYGDNGAVAAFLGINKFGVSRPKKDYVAPQTVADVTKAYKQKLQGPINVNGFTIVEE